MKVGLAWLMCDTESITDAADCSPLPVSEYIQGFFRQPQYHNRSKGFGIVRLQLEKIPGKYRSSAKNEIIQL